MDRFNALGRGAQVMLVAVLKNLTDDFSTFAAYLGVVLAAAIALGAWLEVQAAGGMDTLRSEIPTSSTSSSGTSATSVPPPPSTPTPPESAAPEATPPPVEPSPPPEPAEPTEPEAPYDPDQRRDA